MFAVLVCQTLVSLIKFNLRQYILTMTLILNDSYTWYNDNKNRLSFICIYPGFVVYFSNFDQGYMCINDALLKGYKL